MADSTGYARLAHAIVANAMNPPPILSNQKMKEKIGDYKCRARNHQSFLKKRARTLKRFAHSGMVQHFCDVYSFDSTRVSRAILKNAKVYEKKARRKINFNQE